MNQAIPLANPGLTLDDVIVESPRPKATIVTIKIRSVIVYLIFINNFFCLHFNTPLYQTVTSQFYRGVLSFCQPNNANHDTPHKSFTIFNTSLFDDNLESVA